MATRCYKHLTFERPNWATLPRAGGPWGKSPRRRSRRCVARAPRGCPARGRWTVQVITQNACATSSLFRLQPRSIRWLRFCAVSFGLRSPMVASALDAPLNMKSAGPGSQAKPCLDVYILSQCAVRLPHCDLIPLEEILHVDSCHPNLVAFHMHFNQLVTHHKHPSALSRPRPWMNWFLRRSRHFAHLSPARRNGIHLGSACKGLTVH